MPNEFLDSQLNSQFITPDRQNRETIRQMGYAFVDLITDEVLASQDRD
jgi:hypothetical protein